MARVSLGELADALRPRYLRASRREGLDEFVAVSGYYRKAAIRLLRKGRGPKDWERRGRPKVDTNEVKAVLIQVGEVCGRICSKRLAPFLAEMVTVLEREGERKLPEDVRQRLVRLSPATIDRLLRTHREHRPRCRAKPGTKLRQAIPTSGC